MNREEVITEAGERLCVVTCCSVDDSSNPEACFYDADSTYGADFCQAHGEIHRNGTHLERDPVVSYRDALAQVNSAAHRALDPNDPGFRRNPAKDILVSIRYEETLAEIARLRAALSSSAAHLSAVATALSSHDASGLACFDHYGDCCPCDALHNATAQEMLDHRALAVLEAVDAARESLNVNQATTALTCAHSSEVTTSEESDAQSLVDAQHGTLARPEHTGCCS